MAILSVADYSKPNLFKRLVSQYIISSYRKQSDMLGYFSSKDSWVNSIAEYVFMSLPQAKDFSTTSNVDDVLNAGTPQVITKEFKIEVLKIINQSINIKKLYASWTTETARNQYIKSIANNIIKAIDKLEKEVLITATIQGTNKITSYDFDNDSTDLKFDTKAIKIGAVDETENQRVKRILNIVRTLAISLKSPSTNWTKFARAQALIDVKNDHSYNINSPSQLIMIVNGHFASKVADLTANLFNKGDVLPLIKQDVIDFSKYGYTKIESDKIDFILCDENTFKRGSFIDGVSLEMKTFDFKTVLQSLFSIGFAKLPNLPAYIFKQY